MKHLIVLLLFIGCSDPSAPAINYTAIDLNGSWNITVEGVPSKAIIETTPTTVWIDILGFKTFKNAKYKGRYVEATYREYLSGQVYLDYDIDLTISADGKSFTGGVLVMGNYSPPTYQKMQGTR